MKKIFILVLAISFSFSLLAQSISNVRMEPVKGSYNIGETVRIYWDYTGLIIPNDAPAKITLWREGGTQNICLIKADIRMDKGSTGYLWTIPGACVNPHNNTTENLTTSELKIRVRWQGHPVWGETGSFRVNQLVPPALEEKITVKSPRGTLVMGKKYYINWEYQGNELNPCFQIFLFNGSRLVKQIASNICAHSYRWQVPALTSGEAYKVRVRSMHSTTSGDSKNFSIISMKPDLIVRKLSADIHNSGLMQVTFKYIVENIGLGESPPCKAKLVIKGPANYTYTIHNLPIPSLVFGANRLLKISYTPPRSGVYTNTIYIDTPNQIAESNEANNAKSFSYRVPPLPDLIICYRKKQSAIIVFFALSIKNYTSGIEIFVKNVGEKPSPSTRVKIWTEGKGSTFHNVPPLSPGQKYRVFRKQKWHTMGTSSFYAEVDPDKQILESSEENNRADGKIHRTSNYEIQQPMVCTNTENN